MYHIHMFMGIPCHTLIPKTTSCHQLLRNEGTASAVLEDKAGSLGTAMMTKAMTATMSVPRRPGNEWKPWRCSGKKVDVTRKHRWL